MYKNTDYKFEQNLDNIKKFGKDALNNASDFLKNSDSNFLYILISLIIVFFIFFILISWIAYTLSLRNNNCTKMDNFYPDNNSYKTRTFIKGQVNFENPENNLTINNDNFPDNDTRILKNYYVKAAYNCMCADGYKNNWVDDCALENCIKQGARFLDFEIYSLNYQPVVAASTANNYNIKETYNYIYLSEIFEKLHNLAFDEQFTQAYKDPMIIHLRLMTENNKIYDLIANYIDSHLNKQNNYLLDKTNTIGNPNYDHKNIINAKLETFAKKFIIIVYQSESALDKSILLKNKVNLRSNSNYCNLYRYKDLVSMGESNPILMNDSKDKYIIVLPDIDNSLDNYNYFIPLSNGCQVIAMKFQNMDNNLVKYNEFFINKGLGYCFVYKSSKLLYNIPNNISYNTSDIELLSTGKPGSIFIYNYTNNFNTLKYNFYKKSELKNTDIPKKTNYVGKKTHTNNEFSKIDLTSDLRDNSYIIEIIDFETEQKLTKKEIQILATGTQGSAAKANFNEYPLDTNNPEKNKFTINPYLGDNIVNIVLNIRSLSS